MNVIVQIHFSHITMLLSHMKTIISICYHTELNHNLFFSKEFIALFNLLGVMLILSRSCLAKQMVDRCTEIYKFLITLLNSGPFTCVDYP